ncbi:hypothetical protein KAJ83_05110 [Marivibrio halodurans]|uniref:Uncharacterized protein n=1 Tax=Marivibrio halodurans TaxID=2039722 RepID=A0A8J7RXS9_9PROT|nr:hypothetical protein [Marivibrio halodurans]MBP5856375.1 hypothetical protein [Marivibrio halodurans]
MPLNIETFSNRIGGISTFKALGHPLAVAPARALMERLAAAGPVALYDPLGMAEAVNAIHDLSGLDLCGLYVQDIEAVGAVHVGLTAQPVTDLKASGARTVLLTAFEADRLADHVRHLLPEGAEIVTLDAIRIPEAMQTNRRRYLDNLNWATNFAFFRDDDDGHHTRLVTANYWGGYGAKDVEVWCCLFDAAGEVLADWREALGPANGTFTVDSKAVRRRFGLGPFTGQLFLHVIGAAGHDIVKYALDTYGEGADVLSCTHDANAWPADLYAGLPAPASGERVVLWVQNSHPTPIPKGAIGLNRMGRERVAWLEEEVPAFGSHALDVSTLMPGLSWPEQIEIQAGKHFVRPRYEITKADGRLRISHPNVERVDLKPDPKIPDLANLMGKGYLLPAPILPPAHYESLVLPTPMSTAQDNLPIAVVLLDRTGNEIARHGFGCLPRDHAEQLDLGRLAVDSGLAPEDYGHAELIYDFADGGEADGWLHGLFRYTDARSGHAAETSFGAHIFNHILTYRNEPQSYAGRPPGLSTRLFLRIGPDGYDAFCHLIYPASTDWHASSDTRLSLMNASGVTVAERAVAIPCGGSYRFTQRGLFDAAECAAAGDAGYILIRDVTCRLFGYHGLMAGENGASSFSLDHMFGF